MKVYYRKLTEEDEFWARGGHGAVTRMWNELQKFLRDPRRYIRRASVQMPTKGVWSVVTKPLYMNQPRQRLVESHSDNGNLCLDFLGVISLVEGGFQ